MNVPFNSQTTINGSATYLIERKNLLEYLVVDRFKLNKKTFPCVLEVHCGIGCYSTLWLRWLQTGVYILNDLNPTNCKFDAQKCRNAANTLANMIPPTCKLATTGTYDKSSGKLGNKVLGPHIQ